MSKTFEQLLPVISAIDNRITGARKNISVKQLGLDYYPMDMLPQVTLFENKKCLGFNTTTKLPGTFTEQQGQDIYQFNLAELIAEGVQEIFVYDQADVVGQRVIAWTENEFATNVIGTVADGVRRIKLSKISRATWILITFTHGNAWMKFTKDYSEDTIQRGVTGWLRKEDFQNAGANLLDDATVKSIQIETEITTYTALANKVGETYEKGQIMDTNPVTYKISTNVWLFLSILDLAPLITVNFFMNAVERQMGAVIYIVDRTGYSLVRLSVKKIENGETSYCQYDADTRSVTVDCNEIKREYPNATRIWICSASNKGVPEVFLTNQKHLADFKWLYDNTEEDDAATLILPSKIPAVIGMPVYCYFENMLSKGFLKDFTVTTESGIKTRREVYKEIPATVGEKTKVVSVFKGENLVNTGSFKIKTIAKESSEVKSVKVLCIGDSKTEAAGKRVMVNKLVDDDPYLNLTFIGTRGQAPTLSEGYSGRNIIEVCRSETLGNAANIFYDQSISGDNKFNFSKGIGVIGEVPDIVFIDHGANQYGQLWSTVLECYEFIIDSIHSYDQSIKIVVSIQECSGLATKPDYTQGNKYGYGYGNGGSNYSLPKMITAFDNREEENVFICPQYLCVDLYNDFPLAMLPASECNQLKRYFCLDNVHCGTNSGSWSASTTYPMYSYIRKNGKSYAAVQESTNVDPETDDGTYWTPIVNPEAGYNKIGEMYYAVIKYILSLS